ncbi:hypothetical protein HW555_003237, partial [Spodoptera exigua]
FEENGIHFFEFPEPEPLFRVDPFPSAPVPGPSSYMDLPSSPIPGTSSAIDPVSVELERMMSPQESEQLYDIPGLQLYEDEELYGILTGNNEELLNEFSDASANEDANIVDSHANEQNGDPEEESLEETTGWFSGNPSQMLQIPFTWTSGMLQPHDAEVQSPLDFFLFMNARFLNLILECTNKYGNKLKAEATTARSRFRP